MGYKIGQKLVPQKNQFVGAPGGPESHENVGHLIDL